MSKLVDCEALGKTDIDLILEAGGQKIFVQAKRSASAFKGGAKKVKEWIAKAREAGAVQIIYVTPDFNAVPRAAKKALEAAGVIEIPVPFK